MVLAVEEFTWNYYVFLNYIFFGITNLRTYNFLGLLIFGILTNFEWTLFWSSNLSLHLNDSLLLPTFSILLISRCKNFHTLQMPLHLLFLNFWNMLIIRYLLLSQWFVNLPLLLAVRVALAINFILNCWA